VVEAAQQRSHSLGFARGKTLQEIVRDWLAAQAADKTSAGRKVVACRGRNNCVASFIARACVRDKMSVLAASKSAGDHGVSISAELTEELKSASGFGADVERESASGWGGSKSERERRLGWRGWGADDDCIMLTLLAEAGRLICCCCCCCCCCCKGCNFCTSFTKNAAAPAANVCGKLQQTRGGGQLSAPYTREIIRLKLVLGFEYRGSDASAHV
jgi:hypothetical protein